MAPMSIAALILIGLYQGWGQETAPATSSSHHLVFVGSYASGWFDMSGSEIAAYHPSSRRLFVLDGAVGLDVLDISKPSEPTNVGRFRKYGPTSVAIHGDLVAAAFSSPSKSARGEVVFMSIDAKVISRIRTGHGPDMIAFTPDGSRLLVANEGEPDEDNAVDPEGSITVIDLSNGAERATTQEAGFASFEASRPELVAAGVHLPMPGRTLAQQFEPEYIAIAPDGLTAFVTIQEANAVAHVDIASCTVTRVVPLGFKDFSASGLDASDKDGRADISPWPVLGLRQPDGIAVWTTDSDAGSQVMFAIAEEGEARETAGFHETEHVARMPLDPKGFPLRASHEEGWCRTDLVKPELLGQLEVSRLASDTDSDGDADRLVAFGGRGISVWRWRDGGAELVWDSGSLLERTVAERMPKAFNANNSESPSRDSRSRSKGPEPEGIATALVNGRRLLAVGLERTGGVALFDATNPSAPVLLDFVNRRDPSVDLDQDDDRDGIPDRLADAGDLGPEGLLVIPADQSPDGTPLLVVCNEVSGTTTLWRIERGPAPTTNPRRGL